MTTPELTAHLYGQTDDLGRDAALLADSPTPQPEQERLLDDLRALAFLGCRTEFGAAIARYAAETIDAQQQELERLRAALAEAEARERNLTAIYQEKMRRLGRLRKFVWEQFRRKIPEMQDVGKDMDFLLSIPLRDTNTGDVLSLEQALATAQEVQE